MFIRLVPHCVHWIGYGIKLISHLLHYHTYANMNTHNMDHISHSSLVQSRANASREAAVIDNSMPSLLDIPSGEFFACYFNC